MNTAEHTPTPWTFKPSTKNTEAADIMVKSKWEGQEFDNIASIWDNCNANAAYIVKAVNCHEQLVYALRKLLEDGHDDFGVGIAALAAAEAQ